MSAFFSKHWRVMLAMLALALVVWAAVVRQRPPQDSAAAPASYSTAAAASDSPRADSAAGDAASARRYATFCAACHGRNGEGVPSLGPAILTPTYLASRADSTIIRIIANGAPGTSMMAFAGTRFGQLSPEEIRALVQWMRMRGASTR